MPAHSLPAGKRSLFARILGVLRDDDADEKHAAELAAARKAKREAEELEARTQERIRSARRPNDTRVRRISKASDSLSTVLLPMNGKSIAELAAEELERDEREAAAS